MLGPCLQITTDILQNGPKISPSLSYAAPKLNLFPPKSKTVLLFSKLANDTVFQTRNMEVIPDPDFFQFSPICSMSCFLNVFWKWSHIYVRPLPCFKPFNISAGVFNHPLPGLPTSSLRLHLSFLGIQVPYLKSWPHLSLVDNPLVVFLNLDRGICDPERGI